MPSHKASPLKPLSSVLQKWCLDGDRYKRITAHLAQGKPEHPVSETEQEALMEEVALALHMHPSVACQTEEGQPFRL